MLLPCCCPYSPARQLEIPWQRTCDRVKHNGKMSPEISICFLNCLVRWLGEYPILNEQLQRVHAIYSRHQIRDHRLVMEFSFRQVLIGRSENSPDHNTNIGHSDIVSPCRFKGSHTWGAANTFNPAWALSMGYTADYHLSSNNQLKLLVSWISRQPLL